MDLHAQQKSGLTEEDQQRGAGDEAAHHRAAQQVGQEAQPQHAKCEYQQAREQGQRGGQGNVLVRARNSKRTEQGIGHDRRDGHRPDRLRHAAAHQRIGDGRQDAYVQPHLRRQACQQGVGQTLGQHEYRDQKTSNQVCTEVLARIVVPPQRRQTHRLVQRNS